MKDVRYTFQIKVKISNTMAFSSFLSKEKEDLYNADINEIIPGIFIGNAKASQNPLTIQQNKINMVVNCTKDIPFLEWIPYKIRLAINDDRNPKEIQAFQKEIDKVVGYIYDHVTNGNTVLVHCRAGIQRSASVVSAFLMKYSEMNIQQSVEFIQTKRKQTFFGGINFYPALSYYYEQLQHERKTKFTQQNSDSSGSSNSSNSSFKSNISYSPKIMDRRLTNQNRQICYGNCNSNNRIEHITPHPRKIQKKPQQPNRHIVVNKKIIRQGSQMYHIKV